MSHYSDLKYPPSVLFDKELELRNFKAAAISATTAEAPPKKVSDYWPEHPPFSPRKQDSYRLVVQQAAIGSYNASTAYWTVTLESDATSDFSSPVTLASQKLLSAAGQLTIPLSGEQVASLDSGAYFLRVKATITGSPGALSYGAFITWLK